ncbi:beta-N-acetylhexosaminidase [Ruminiclostridium cellobioparum]|uniref:Beta-glucosidase-related glycosidase n=1 Tax=Ruminiclostridium cellobioparum subsp. termitidis CT1112 TaxID=1195236 RepID=S0FUE4_RUMCE|nr:Beta-glucosidase-related glycosidase [Ruminiclostridium cellobioparum subsp. termitidis CT1112]
MNKGSRKETYRRKRRSRVGIGLSLTAVAVVVLGYVLVQNLGLPQVLKPSGGTRPGGAAESTSAATSGMTGGPGNTTAQNSPDTAEPGQDSQTDQIKALIDSMTLEEKVGQLVIVGVDGYENDEHSKQLMEKYHAGGFILFKKNIQDSAQLLTLLNSLKETNAALNKVPMFLSVDEEGGRVSRLPDEFKKFPSNKVIGQKNDSSLSYQIGNILGRELSSFGFNMDFAPVVDINSNPKNPVIGDRSFGTTAGLVSRLGIETMKGIRAENVISVVKHFPGHGDTSVDSHVGLPRVNHDLKRLESFELVPFKAAIENSVDAIMIAHILLPKLDPENPASFSKAVITDLLRTDMNFNGVVITDDFTMGAIEKNYDMGGAAVKSIQAGADIVLVCHGFDKQETVIKALLAAAQTGQISTGRLDGSVYRVLELKQRYSLGNAPAGPVDPQKINAEISVLFK